MGVTSANTDERYVSSSVPSSNEPMPLFMSGRSSLALHIVRTMQWKHTSAITRNMNRLFILKKRYDTELLLWVRHSFLWPFMVCWGVTFYKAVPSLPQVQGSASLEIEVALFHWSGILLMEKFLNLWNLQYRAVSTLLLLATFLGSFQPLLHWESFHPLINAFHFLLAGGAQLRSLSPKLLRCCDCKWCIDSSPTGKMVFIHALVKWCIIPSSALITAKECTASPLQATEPGKAPYKIELEQP